MIFRPSATPETIGVVGESISSQWDGWSQRSVDLATLLSNPELTALIQTQQASKPKLYHGDKDINHIDYLMNDFRQAKKLDELIFKFIEKQTRKAHRIEERKRREKIIRKILAKRADLRRRLLIQELAFLAYEEKMKEIEQRILNIINSYQYDAIKKMEDLYNQIGYLQAKIEHIKKLREENLNKYSKEITQQLCDPNNEFQLKKDVKPEQVQEKVKDYIKAKSKVAFNDDLIEENNNKSKSIQDMLAEIEREENEVLQAAVVNQLGEPKKSSVADEDPEITELLKRIEEDEISSQDDIEDIKEFEEEIKHFQEEIDKIDKITEAKEKKIKEKEKELEVKAKPAPLLDLIAIGVGSKDQADKIRAENQMARYQAAGKLQDQDFEAKQRAIRRGTKDVDELGFMRQRYEVEIAARLKELHDLKTHLQLTEASLDSKRVALQALQQKKAAGRVGGIMYSAEKRMIIEKIERNDSKLIALKEKKKKLREELANLTEVSSMLAKEREEAIVNLNMMQAEILGNFEAKQKDNDAAATHAEAAILAMLEKGAVPAVATDLALAHEQKHYEMQLQNTCAAAAALCWDSNEELNAIKTSTGVTSTTGASASLYTATQEKLLTAVASVQQPENKQTLSPRAGNK